MISLQVAIGQYDKELTFMQISDICIQVYISIDNIHMVYVYYL